MPYSNPARFPFAQFSTSGEKHRLERMRVFIPAEQTG